MTAAFYLNGSPSRAPRPMSIKSAGSFTASITGLLYTAKVYGITPETREQWIKTLTAATIETTSVGLEDVDSVIPFELDKVVAALKRAMESADCIVKEATANRIECKRPRNTTGENSYGGGRGTAELEAREDRQPVGITTGKGFYGRLGKRSWSIPIFEQMRSEERR